MTWTSLLNHARVDITRKFNYKLTSIWQLVKYIIRPLPVYHRIATLSTSFWKKKVVFVKVPNYSLMYWAMYAEKKNTYDSSEYVPYYSKTELIKIRRIRKVFIKKCKKLGSIGAKTVRRSKRYLKKKRLTTLRNNYLVHRKADISNFYFWDLLAMAKCGLVTRWHCDLFALSWTSRLGNTCRNVNNTKRNWYKVEKEDMEEMQLWMKTLYSPLYESRVYIDKEDLNYVEDFIEDYHPPVWDTFRQYHFDYRIFERRNKYYYRWILTLINWFFNTYSYKAILLAAHIANYRHRCTNLHISQPYTNAQVDFLWFLQNMEFHREEPIYFINTTKPLHDAVRPCAFSVSWSF